MADLALADMIARLRVEAMERATLTLLPSEAIALLNAAERGLDARTEALVAIGRAAATAEIVAWLRATAPSMSIFAGTHLNLADAIERGAHRAEAGR